MRWLISIWLLSICPGMAFAMNWEGHDDWMENMEPAAVYEQALPHAAPDPRIACEPVKPPPADNPYEQIPLRRPDCPAIPPTPSHLR
jgi:hypothetical protein